MPAAGGGFLSSVLGLYSVSICLVLVGLILLFFFRFENWALCFLLYWPLVNARNTGNVGKLQ